MLEQHLQAIAKILPQVNQPSKSSGFPSLLGNRIDAPELAVGHPSRLGWRQPRCEIRFDLSFTMAAHFFDHVGINLVAAEDGLDRVGQDSEEIHYGNFRSRVRGDQSALANTWPTASVSRFQVACSATSCWQPIFVR